MESHGWAWADPLLLGASLPTPALGLPQACSQGTAQRQLGHSRESVLGGGVAGPALGGGLHGDELEGWPRWPGLSWHVMWAKGRSLKGSGVARGHKMGQ